MTNQTACALIPANILIRLVWVFATRNVCLIGSKCLVSTKAKVVPVFIEFMTPAGAI